MVHTNCKYCTSENVIKYGKYKDKRVPGLRDTDGIKHKTVVYKIIDGVKTPVRTE